MKIIGTMTVAVIAAFAIGSQMPSDGAAVLVGIIVGVLVAVPAALMWNSRPIDATYTEVPETQAIEVMR